MSQCVLSLAAVGAVDERYLTVVAVVRHFMRHFYFNETFYETFCIKCSVFLRHFDGDL